ncbi:2-C-methyl-D-erythritol 4-phosphate cytidylyltransferase [Alkalicoccobacillus porphyridii]|uniref:2-C-methyl-D-erythritol 4-phosphate cytidylyltransferase n=1 Tax=Alkalicoccobacillus porphyridii TaxID=2597270 RepID=A0A553ZTH9_9BACI|nr:2-C-methyl-D-erythritol 4-phosphate cytidylyltransferase [Alkalicoccobacillus porphyridii]TSB44645.1 2-C-methyl-D-erythritol 4-phosphate cytidylyltransferase [Alkalicoccobacillus porphyridii]
MMYSIVIPAAGQGKRMRAGKNKQFIVLNQIPLIAYTLKVFEEDEWCKQIILVANESEVDAMQAIVDTHQISKVSKITVGGEERQQSVYEGVKQLTGPDEIVLVHDGARPFIRKASIHRLVQAAKDAGSAVVAVPMKDTVKRVVNGTIEETINRSSLWSVQTPQAFWRDALLAGHKKAEEQDFKATDDASIMEWIGAKVVVVEGDYSNLKITTPEDLLMAEAIIRKRSLEHDSSRTRI